MQGDGKTRYPHQFSPLSVIAIGIAGALARLRVRVPLAVRAGQRFAFHGTEDPLTEAYRQPAGLWMHGSTIMLVATCDTSDKPRILIRNILPNTKFGDVIDVTAYGTGLRGLVLLELDETVIGIRERLGMPRYDDALGS